MRKHMKCVVTFILTISMILSSVIQTPLVAFGEEVHEEFTETEFSSFFEASSVLVDDNGPREQRVFTGEDVDVIDITILPASILEEVSFIRYEIFRSRMLLGEWEIISEDIFFGYNIVHTVHNASFNDEGIYSITVHYLLNGAERNMEIGPFFLDVSEDVDITAHFTDSNFRAAVFELVGRNDRSIYLSDISEINFLDVSGREINSLAGIENFPALMTLNVNDNNLTQLDISSNTNISWLDLRQNDFDSEDDVTGWEQIGLTLGHDFLFDPQNGAEVQEADVAPRGITPQVSGSAGVNITWTLALDSGLLEIRGFGEMENFTESNPAPWYYHRGLIRSVFVSAGITSLGDRAFANLSNLTIAHVPNTVRTLGENVYQGTNSLVHIRIFNPVQGIMALSATEEIGWGLLLGGFNVTSGNEFWRNNINDEILWNAPDDPDAVAARAALDRLGNQIRSSGNVQTGRTTAVVSSHSSMQELMSEFNHSSRLNLETNARAAIKLFNADVRYRLDSVSGGRHTYASTYENFFMSAEVTHILGRLHVPSTSVFRTQNAIIWEALNPSFRRDVTDYLSLNSSGDSDIILRFFDKWGSHIVTSYNFGGLAEYNISISRVERSSSNSIASRVNHQGSLNARIGSFFNTSNSVELDNAESSINEFRTDDYFIARSGRLSGGTGSGTALAALSEWNLGDIDTWLNSVTPQTSDILIDNNLSMVGIWELLPPTMVRERAMLERAFNERVTADQADFFRDFIRSTVILEQPNLERPTNYRNAEIIATADDLNRLRQNPSGNFILANDIFLNGDWEPFAFSGRLEGAGNTIHGAHLTNINSGFFTSVSGSSANDGVRNLGIVFSSRFNPNNSGIASSVSGMATVINGFSDFSPRAHNVPIITNAGDIPARISGAGSVWIIDLRGVTAALNRTIIIEDNVETVIFRGAPGITFTGLNLIVAGNTNVVLENFSFYGMNNAAVLQFSGVTLPGPALISSSPPNVSASGNIIRSAATSNHQVIHADGHLYIGGRANLTVTHRGAVTTAGNPDAMVIGSILHIGMTHTNLRVDGGRGVDGIDGISINGRAANGGRGANGVNGGSDHLARNGAPGGTGASGVGAGGSGTPGSRGGHAISANEVSILYDARLELTGGRGGDGGNGGRGQGGGHGGRGGDGGTNRGWPHITETGAGGRGGNGGNGARGGDGGGGGDGGSPLNVSGERFLLSQNTRLVLHAGVGGNGGNGGISEGGDGGRGGNAGVRASTGGVSVFRAPGIGGNGGTSNSGNGGATGHNGSLEAVRSFTTEESITITHSNDGIRGGGNIFNFAGAGGGGGFRAHDNAWQSNGEPGVFTGIIGEARPLGGHPGPHTIAPTPINGVIPQNYWGANRLVVRQTGDGPNFDYFANGWFEDEGFEFKIIRPDGREEGVSPSNIVFGFDFSREDEVAIVTATLRHGGNELIRHIPVRINPPDIVDVRFRAPAPNTRGLTRIFMDLDDTFIPGGFALEVERTDGSIEVINDLAPGFDVSYPSYIDTQAGTHTVIVNYGRFMDMGPWRYTVTTMNNDPVFIELVTGLPPNRRHIEDMPFDPTGMSFRLHFPVGEPQIVGPESVDFSVDIFPFASNNFVITASVGQVSLELPPIVVEADPISGIGILSGLVTDYFVGQRFDASNLRLELERPQFMNHIPVPPQFVTINPARVVNEGLLASDTQVMIVVNMPGRGTWSQAVPVTVRQVVPEGIRLVSFPDEQRTYFEGQSFNTNGLVVERFYNDPSRPSTRVNLGDLNISHGVLGIEDTAVEISYGGLPSIFIGVRVNPITATSFELVEEPNVTIYEQGENFNPAGMVLRAEFNHGTPNENVTNFTVYPNRPLEVTDSHVIISFMGQSVTIPIRVYESLDVTAPQVWEQGSVPYGTEVFMWSETPGAVIHYTRDGSEPTEASPVHNDPIIVRSATNIRARAFMENMRPSPISQFNFTVEAGIGITPAGGVDFGNRFVGYERITPRTVTITNASGISTGALNIAVYRAVGEDSIVPCDNFVISRTSIGNIMPNGSETFTVAPRVGLPIGEYWAVVIVEGSGVENRAVHVSFSVLPQDTSAIIIPSVSASPGSEATLNISLNNNPGFAGMPLRISFPDELTLTSFQLANLGLLSGFTGPDGVTPGIIGMAPGSQTSISESFYMIWGRTADYAEDGVIAALTFAVDQDTEPGFYPITITFETHSGPDIPTNLQGEGLSIVIINGGVSIATIVLGSVSGSGSVGTADLVLLARFLAGHNVTIVEDAARVTSDSITQGIIRTADLVMLARFLAGHNVTLGS